MKNEKFFKFKKRWLILGICLVSVVSILLSEYLLQGSKLSAHPSQTITIDANDLEKSYEIPVDGEAVTEPELPEVYTRFSQDSSIKPSLEKGTMHSYYDDRLTNLASIYSTKLANGNFVVATQKATVQNGVNLTGNTVIYTTQSGEVISIIDEKKTGRYNRIEGLLGETENSQEKLIEILGIGKYEGTTYFLLIHIDTENGNEITITPTVSASTSLIKSHGLVINLFDSANGYPTLSGQIYNNASEEGIEANKTPIFEYDTKVDSLNYLFSLETAHWTEVNPDFIYTDQGFQTASKIIELANPNQGYMGLVSYGDGRKSGDLDYQRSTVQRFNSDGTINKVIDIAKGSKKFKVLGQLNSDNYYYYFEYDDAMLENSYLKCVDLSNNSIEILKTYEPGTNLLIMNNENQLTYYGYTPNMTGEFQGFSGYETGNVVIGVMDSSFNISTANSLESNGSVSFTNIENSYIDDEGFNHYFVTGSTRATDFTEAPVSQGLFPDNGSPMIWWGEMKIKNDYSPIIGSEANQITLNIENEDIYSNNKDQNNYTSLDRWLIFGDNTINYSSEKAINVYDKQDVEATSIIGDTVTKRQDWLNSRINRNPNAIENDIDWAALGFEDDGKVGANRVTYFITDSQKQTTSTSRIVNKIDSHTVVNKEGALAAYNFAITLDELVNLTDESLRNSDKYANLTAWDLDTGESILSLPANEGIEIDAEQLADIKAATEFGVYPLTFKLNYGEEYKEVTISVFVSHYEPIGDYVYDLEPISMPWDVSKDISGEDYPNSEFSKDGIHVYTAYKISTGEKIDENNPNYQLIGDVTNLNACDPNPNDYTATEAVKVPVSIWTRGATPTKEVDLPNTPDTTVYYRTEDIKVSFVDWNFATLYDVEGNQLQAAGVTLANQIVGKNTAIKTNAQVVAAIETILLKGYEKEDYYLEDKTAKLTTDSVLVELNNGDGATYYLRFKGLLEIISVPTVDFGLHNTATAWGGSLREDDPDVTGSLIISDTRADTTKNWTLKAELSEPLTSLDGSVTIPDAIRYKRSGQPEFVLSTEKQIMMANDAGTFGTFDVSETWGSTKDSDGFKFEAPAAKVKKLTKYQATIKYTLSDTYEP